MITLKDLTKIYRMGSSDLLVLNSVNLTAERGDFLAVMGPSGSGKSTLLYTVGGLLSPTKGEVIVNDTSIYKLSPRERSKFRRENVGFIFQSFELLPYLTAIENVMLPMYLAGASSTEQEESAEAALKKVGLENRAFHKPAELSGGEQQRVAIARGVVGTPDIILADEPTGNLDQETGNEIMQLLYDLHEEDELTTIVVTHDAKIAERAHRVMRMIDGRVGEDEDWKKRR